MAYNYLASSANSTFGQYFPDQFSCFLPPGYTYVGVVYPAPSASGSIVSPNVSYVLTLMLWYFSANPLMSRSGIFLPSLPSLPRPHSLDLPPLQNVTQYHLNRHPPQNQVVETPFPCSTTFARNGAAVYVTRPFGESGNVGDI